jgi:hypothetical protein
MNLYSLSAVLSSCLLFVSLSSGCAVQEGPSSETSVTSELLYKCDGSQERYIAFYSDAARTSFIGYWLCPCYGAERSEGGTSRYYTIAEYACFAANPQDTVEPASASAPVTINSCRTECAQQYHACVDSTGDKLTCASEFDACVDGC